MIITKQPEQILGGNLTNSRFNIASAKIKFTRPQVHAEKITVQNTLCRKRT